MSSRTPFIDGSAAAQHVSSGPVLTAAVHMPQDVPPTVGIRPITAAVVAGQPVSVTVTADQGTHWFIDPEGDLDSKPIVTYTGTTVVLDDAVVASGQDAGGTFMVTFPRPGDHLLQASCTTTAAGTVVTSAQVPVRVKAAGPPAFTVTSPGKDATVDLNEGGGSVDITLSIPPDAFFPLDVERHPRRSNHHQQRHQHGLHDEDHPYAVAAGTATDHHPGSGPGRAGIWPDHTRQRPGRRGPASGRGVPGILGERRRRRSGQCDRVDARHRGRCPERHGRRERRGGLGAVTGWTQDGGASSHRRRLHRVACRRPASRVRRSHHSRLGDGRGRQHHGGAAGCSCCRDQLLRSWHARGAAG